MNRTPDRRVLTVVIALLVALIAVGAAVVWWYGQSYLERAGGLRESEARTHCGDEVRWETGYGKDAELDLWGPGSTRTATGGSSTARCSRNTWTGLR